MATATETRVRSKRLYVTGTTTILFVTPTGLRGNRKGDKVFPTGVVLGTMTKSLARKVRKALRRIGETCKSGAARQRDPKIVELVAKLEKHTNKVEAFYNDPMTDHCSCTSDFQEDFDKQARKLAADLHKRAMEVGDEKAQDFAAGILEQWMP